MGEGGGGVRKNKWETVEEKHKEKSADVCVLQEQAGWWEAVVHDKHCYL